MAIYGQALTNFSQEAIFMEIREIVFDQFIEEREIFVEQQLSTADKLALLAF